MTSPDLKVKDPFVIWLTGLSGSGKSTVAINLRNRLMINSIDSTILDGDVIRKGLNSDLGFSINDRKENMRRIAEVSKIIVDSGGIVIVSFISPFAGDRDKIRNCF